MIDTDEILNTISLEDVITADLGQPSHEGMWSCPFHDERTPSFGIVAKDPRFFKCLGCGASGDAIHYVMYRQGIDFVDACRRLTNGRKLPTHSAPKPQKYTTRPKIKPSEPPQQSWTKKAQEICERAKRSLLSDQSQWARDYIESRGIALQTAKRWTLGCSNHDRWYHPLEWGLPADHKRVYLPTGIVFPWWIDGEVWRVNVRRLNVPKKKRYMGPAGFKNGLFNADAVSTDKPVILVEGEFDAILIEQEAGDIITPVATGTTSGARVQKWIYRLITPPLVLVSFDREKSGENAADFWLEKLKNSRRWLPTGKDPGEMHNIRSWIKAGVGLSELHPDQTVTKSPPEQKVPCKPEPFFVERTEGIIPGFLNWAAGGELPPRQKRLHQQQKQARMWNFNKTNRR